MSKPIFTPSMYVLSCQISKCSFRKQSYCRRLLRTFEDEDFEMNIFVLKIALGQYISKKRITNLNFEFRKNRFRLQI